MDDPYLQPGTDCLANKLNITNPAILAAYESQIVAVRDVEIAKKTFPGAYNTPHYKAFHKRLFGDVYAWAGELRIVRMSKGTSPFCMPLLIESQLDATLGGLCAEQWLRDIPQRRFVEASPTITAS